MKPEIRPMTKKEEIAYKRELAEEKREYDRIFRAGILEGRRQLAAELRELLEVPKVEEEY